MRRLRIGILDLIGNRPTPGLWNRLMKPNFASIMPQVIAVWCEQLGHEVRFLCHTGSEDIERELPPPDLDLLFIAGRLKEAKRLESVLDAAGINYLIETDTYRGGFIFVTERIGAFFYSRPEDTERARQAMIGADFKPYNTGD